MHAPRGEHAREIRDASLHTLILNRNKHNIHTHESYYAEYVEKSIVHLVNWVGEDAWTKVLEGLFNTPTPAELSDIFSEEYVSDPVKSAHSGEIFRQAYTLFQERLINFHHQGVLRKVLEASQIKWPIGHPEKQKIEINLQYYGDLLCKKASGAKEWATANGIEIKKFGQINFGFLVYVLRPNWPLFYACLKEVVEKNLINEVNYLITNTRERAHRQV